MNLPKNKNTVSYERMLKEKFPGPPLLGHLRGGVDTERMKELKASYEARQAARLSMQGTEQPDERRIAERYFARSVSRFLRKALDDYGIDERELARFLEIGPGLMGEYLRGQKIPGMRTLAKLLDLNKDWSWEDIFSPRGGGDDGSEQP